MIRYNRLPTRFLQGQDEGLRAYLRRASEAGLLYFRPGVGAAAGLQVLDGLDEQPAPGWLQVTTGADPERAERAWRGSRG